MSPVTFNEPSYASRAGTPKRKGIVGWLIARGFVKDERGANVVMLSIAAIGFLVIIGIWISAPHTHKQTAAETARIQASTQQPSAR